MVEGGGMIKGGCAYIISGDWLLRCCKDALERDIARKEMDGDNNDKYRFIWQIYLKYK